MSVLKSCNATLCIYNGVSACLLDDLVIDRDGACARYSPIILEFKGDYDFLSNFYPAEVVFSGIKFPTVEHAFVAGKTLDMGERRHIATIATAGQAKRYGRQLRLREDWDLLKLTHMEDLIDQKFGPLNPGLQMLLLRTQQIDLTEGNRWGDTFWGVNLNNNEGHNHLGKILMRKRERLFNEFLNRKGGVAY